MTGQNNINFWETIIGMKMTDFDPELRREKEISTKDVFMMFTNDELMQKLNENPSHFFIDCTHKVINGYTKFYLRGRHKVNSRVNGEL